MSDRRDLVYFKKTFPAATVAADAFSTFSIAVNNTNLLWGALPPDSHKSLRGTIEHLVITSEAATGTLDVMVFSKAVDGTNLATDSYLDHESFVGSDFVTHNGTVVNASAGGLTIPYVDRDGAKAFHFGFRSGVTVNSIGLQMTMLVGWRADRGEP